MFLDGYKKTSPFSDGLGEFDEAKNVVSDLIAEYEDAEKETYLDPDAQPKALEGSLGDLRIKP